MSRGAGKNVSDGYLGLCFECCVKEKGSKVVNYQDKWYYNWCESGSSGKVNVLETRRGEIRN